MPAISAFFQDAYKPVMFNSPALAVTVEQRIFIREILELCASDSRFAQKAYDAIEYVLTNGSVQQPTITSLVPNAATLGSPSFDLSVRGTGFTPTSQIVWNGSPEPTTFVNSGELKTGVNMDTAIVAVPIPVNVVSDSGVLSNASIFTFNPSNPSRRSGREELIDPPRKDDGLKDKIRDLREPLPPARKDESPRDVVKDDPRNVLKDNEKKK